MGYKYLGKEGAKPGPVRTFRISTRPLNYAAPVSYLPYFLPDKAVSSSLPAEVFKFAVGSSDQSVRIPNARSGFPRENTLSQQLRVRTSHSGSVSARFIKGSNILKNFLATRIISMYADIINSVANISF